MVTCYTCNQLHMQETNNCCSSKANRLCLDIHQIWKSVYALYHYYVILFRFNATVLLLCCDYFLNYSNRFIKTHQPVKNVSVDPCKNPVQKNLSFDMFKNTDPLEPFNINQGVDFVVFNGKH
ncbi:hypothetical protein Hanom_Chr14g01304171 [Helianthus anomalus]